MTLVEVLVAFSVLMIALLPLTYLLDTQVGQASQARNRLTALSLAEKWVEILGNQSPPTKTTNNGVYQCGLYSSVNAGTNTGEPIVGTPLTPVSCTSTGPNVTSSGTAVPTVTESSVTYRLSAEYFWTADQNGTQTGDTQPNLCSTTGTPKVLELVMTVAWGGSLTVQDSVLLDYPPPGIQTNGYVAVQVTGDSNVADIAGHAWSTRVQTVPVTFTQSAPLVSGGPTQQPFTIHPDQYGCAFAEVEPGTWTATIADPGSDLNPAVPVTPAYVANLAGQPGTVTSAATTVGIGDTATPFPGGIAFDQGSLVDLSYPSSTAVEDGVVCPAAGKITCISTGQSGSGAVSVLTSYGTAWSASSSGALPSVTRVTGVACGTDCVGVGYGPAPGGGTQGIIAAGDTDGSGRITVTPLPSTSMVTSVVCPSSSTCVVLGDLASGGSGIWSSTNIGGGDTWTQETIPGGITSLAQLVCPSATQCAAVGTSGGNGIAITGTVRGTWTMGTLTSGDTLSSLTSIACPSVMACTATGTGSVSGGPVGPIVVSTVQTPPSDGVGTVANAAWSVDAVPTGVTVTSLAQLVCPSSGQCLVTGYGTDATGLTGGMVLTAAPGGALTEDVLPAPPSIMTDLVCPTASVCTLIGAEGAGTSASPYVPMILSGAVGTGTDNWTADTVPSPTSGTLTGLSQLTCPSASTCLVSATGTDAAGAADAALLSGAVTTTGSGTSTTSSATWSLASLPTALSSSTATEVRYFDGISCTTTGSPTYCAAVGASATGAVVLASDNGPAGSWTTNATPTGLTGLDVTGVPIEVNNSGLQPLTYENLVAAGGAANATGLPLLFPFNPGYGVFAGDCVGEASTTVNAALALGATTPGGTSSTTVPLGLIAVDVEHGGAPVAGASLTLTSTTAGCPADTYRLPATGPEGLTRVLVPYGSYKLSIAGSATTVALTVKSNSIDAGGAVITLPEPLVVAS